MKLDDINKNPKPFKVPEGYFDKVTDKIVDKAKDTNAPLTKEVKLRDYRRRWVAAAVAACILVAFTALFLAEDPHPFKSDDVVAEAPPLPEDITATDAELYLLHSGISAYDVALFVEEEDIEISEGHESELEQYLESEIEISDIEDLL
ncbi:hypothetical protein V6R21_31390 [Limibacter armeniacum]|uniref:hypothetical protein n=1 Tax=Limibacter armeniacum TaxID=466084 RepID=UPI002FE55CD9